MQINIHNKFEIFQGDEKYVAYNTISHNILDRISTLSPFATYFAFGDSVGTDSYSRNKMENWILSLPTTLEDINCDISRGQIYVKRSLTIAENAQTGLTFSELGITYSNENNPTICNHVNITDGEGNNVQIKKKSGIALFIRVTIYMTLSSDAQKMLCSGDNKLIRAMLGEYQSPVITAMRGDNLINNNQSINRNTPRVGTRYPCVFSSLIAQNGDSCELIIDFDIDTGATGEVVILFDDYAVARYNVLSYGEIDECTSSTTSQLNRSIRLDTYVDDITEITDASNNVVSNYSLKTYATEFGDFVSNPFDTTITDDNARYVSEDGNKIAFLVGDKVYIYHNVGYTFKKINNNIETQNLTKIIMFEDNVFAIYNGLPRIAFYKIVNNSLVKKTVNLTNYTIFDSTFDWREIEIISNKSNTFMIGIVLGQILRKPVIVSATYANDTLTIDSVSYGQSTYVCYMFALYHNAYCASMIGFITNNFGGVSDTYRIEEYRIGEQVVISNEIPAYYLANNTISVKGKSRAVVANKVNSPYIWIYYYPEVSKFTLNVTAGLDNWISQDILYLIRKYDDQTTPYKIYSLANYDTPQEFTNGFPTEVNLANVTDFEFVDNILLIFSDNSVQAITLKDVHSVVENLPQKSQTYNISYDKVILIGSNVEEGVNGTLSLEITP